VAGFALRTGLDDAALRLGARPTGLWLPECAYAHGLERLLHSHGVDHLMVDEPTLAAGGASLGRPWRLADSPVAVVGRDLGLTDRVWSSRSGYPRASDYRDFHARDPRSGFQAFRVTDPTSADKQHYDPEAGAERARRDAADFVTVVREHLLTAADDGSGLAVVAWDTELFGHWWHEGVLFLEHVLRMMPEAGVRLRTMRTAVEHATSIDEVTLPAGSWGSGKDFRLWSGEPVRDLAAEVACCVRRLVDMTTRHTTAGSRSPVLDQLARQTLLAASSDWTFMVSRDSAAGYARDRLSGHVEAARTLADLIESIGPDDERATAEARGQSRADGPFGALDARLLRS
jgi:1,4-alpha-glucan branching enzyme